MQYDQIKLNVKMKKKKNPGKVDILLLGFPEEEI